MTRPMILLTNALREAVKGGFAILSIAEQAHADALPIAGAKGEGLASQGEVEAIGAV